jgi:predicted DNA-binding transcriptional regulator YafY
LSAIRNEFGIEITYHHSKEGYFIDKEKSINMEAFVRFLEIVNTGNLIAESLSDSRDSLDYIEFDKQGSLKGLEYLSLALRAIKEHRRIRIVHNSYSSKKPKTYKVEPYFLKEYQNRWYLAVYVLGMNEPRTFAIDRLEQIEILDELFKPTKKDELKANFDQVIGLVYSYGKIEDVELVFTPHQGNYVKSLPWHVSQTILVDNDQELRIKLRVIPNFANQSESSKS